MAERNLPPKTRFLADSAAVRAHGTMFSSDIARFALDVAFQQYAWTLWKHSNPNGSLYLEGAQDFIDILLNLGEAPAKPTPQDRKDNLTHA